jgi:tRNA(fMet)-specific endonuclease VapC
MPLYIFDTDSVSLLRTHHPELSRRTLAVPPADRAITVITVEEQLTGWYTYLRRATRPQQVERAYQELAEVVTYLARLPILPFPLATIARFEALRKQKLNVGANDLRIAAIALEHGAVVVTRNVRDFGRVPNLAVEDWTQPAAP